MNSIKEILECENTYVQELMQIWKTQVKNHSKIDNYVSNQKSKISESNFSKACKEKMYYLL